MLIKTVPKSRLRFSAWTGFTPDAALTERLKENLQRERVQGGVIALARADHTYTAAAFGHIRMRDRQPAVPGAFFRCASISKFVTAAGVLRLAAAGQIDLDKDVSEYLGFPVRHPQAPDRPITLRLLLSHRAGLKDGTVYKARLTDPLPLPELLKTDVYMDHLPGEGFEYTNLGSGIIDAVLEAALNMPFDEIMRQQVFAPAGATATFLPQRASGLLADAWRLIPPARTPNYDAQERISRPVPPVDPRLDYVRAQGGLCVTAEDLLRIAALTMSDPACAPMREPLSDFGQRDPHLQEGLGCFIYRDPALPFPLYGHQGLAYGAVHGLFFRADPGDSLTGMALLTSSASEQRAGVITPLNRDCARAVFGQETDERGSNDKSD